MKYAFSWISVGIILSLSILLPKFIHAQISSDSTRLKQQAQIAIQKVDDNNKWLNYLSPEDLNELPVGLKKTINNITYKLAISSIISHETYDELTIFAKIDIPQNSKSLFFGVSGLKLSHSGDVIGDGKLLLLGNVSIALGIGQLVLKGDYNIKNGQTTGDLSYITMDCRGFKEMGIAADILFSRDLLIPCHPNGETIKDETQKVKGFFQTRVNDWNDILVNINIPKFQIKGFDDVIFDISKATFDFSDIRNSPDVIFPIGYEYRHTNTYPSSNLWRGIYIQNLEVILPKAFERKGKQRISFGATHFILDNNGITGLLHAKNILPYDEGNAAGWKFSVDEFQVGLEANQLIAANFKGCIGLPIAQKDSLRYEAMITSDNQYILSVSPKNKIDFKLWQAKVELSSNSYVKLWLENGRFKPEANLNGRLSIDAKMKPQSDKSIAKFKEITFRGMRLRTYSPYFTVDHLGYEGEVKLAGFPVSIDEIVLVTNNNRADLVFNLKLTLQEQAFKGSTRLAIGARFEEQEGYHHYKFDKILVNSIEIKSAKLGVLTLDGKVDLMHDDPMYGDGFAGGLKAKFSPLGGAEVQMRCVFGNNTFRYWFMDGKAGFGTGIPILGPLHVYGFAGGAYYRMCKTGLASGMMDKLTPNYKPDAAMGFGIRAGILFNVIKPETVDGIAEFEVAHNINGGIKYIGLFGNARFMGKMNNVIENAAEVVSQVQNTITNQLEGLSDAAKISKIEMLQKVKINSPTAASRAIPAGDLSGVSAYLGIMYDFDNKTFHSNFDVYVNVVGGLFQGVGHQYRAGYAVIHFDPSQWYIHMGTPTDPIGIKVNIGGFNVQTDSYFMLGTQIPEAPPPPREVANILNTDLNQLDYMRDLNALGTGRGIAFGSKLNISTGDISFLILYANFQAGLGFDLMLKQYNNAHCEGGSNSIGINGWYANAQAYAYLQGELGVKVKLWLIKGRFPIIRGGAAALLQAKLPNPSWFQGHLGIQFNILGGLISGNIRFKLTIGDDCKIIRDNPTPINMSVISDLSPHDTNQVDVFTIPQLTLSFPIEKDIEMEDEHGKKIYQIVLEQFDLQTESQSTTQLIPGKIEWNNNKDVATIYSKDVLPPFSKVKVTARVSFKEQKGSVWHTVYINGKKAEENRILTMNTGAAPETIPLHNIQYSWPVVDQHNFYRDENNNHGFIQLKRGQPYLFDITGYKQGLYLNSNSINQTESIPFVYDRNQCQLRFDLNQTIGDKQYQLLLISKPLSGSINKEASKVIQQTFTEEGSEINIRKLKAQNITRDDVGKEILQYTFHSSRYATFKEKMKSGKYNNTIWRKVNSEVISLQQTTSLTEPFDIADLKGNKYTDGKPLVQPVARINNPYFTEDIQPLIYNNYPLAGNIHFVNRDTSKLGFIPRKALPILNSYLSLVEEHNFEHALVQSNLPYLYDLPRIYKADFTDLQNQVVNRFLNKPQEQSQYMTLINGYYPFMRHGYYEVNYQYILPNGTKGTSYTVKYYNPIGEIVLSE